MDYLKNRNIDGGTCTTMGIFSYVLWRLIVTMLLFNYPPATCGLGYHEIWIISSHLLQIVKELILYNYCKLHKFSVSPYLPLRPLAGTIDLLLRGNILILPPQEPYRAWNTLRPKAYLIDGAIRYILRNGILMPLSVVLHWENNRCLQGLLHR